MNSDNTNGRRSKPTFGTWDTPSLNPPDNPNAGSAGSGGNNVDNWTWDQALGAQFSDLRRMLGFQNPNAGRLFNYANEGFEDVLRNLRFIYDQEIPFGTESRLVLPNLRKALVGGLGTQAPEETALQRALSSFARSGLTQSGSAQQSLLDALNALGTNVSAVSPTGDTPEFLKRLSQSGTPQDTALQQALSRMLTQTGITNAALNQLLSQTGGGFTPSNLSGLRDVSLTGMGQDFQSSLGRLLTQTGITNAALNQLLSQTGGGFTPSALERLSSAVKTQEPLKPGDPGYDPRWDREHPYDPVRNPMGYRSDIQEITRAASDLSGFQPTALQNISAAPSAPQLRAIDTRAASDAQAALFRQATGNALVGTNPAIERLLWGNTGSASADKLYNYDPTRQLQTPTTTTPQAITADKTQLGNINTAVSRLLNQQIPNARVSQDAVLRTALNRALMISDLQPGMAGYDRAGDRTRPFNPITNPEGYRTPVTIKAPSENIRAFSEADRQRKILDQAIQQQLSPERLSEVQAVRGANVRISANTAQSRYYQTLVEQGLPEFQAELLARALGETTEAQRAAEEAQLASAARAQRLFLANDPYSLGGRGLAGSGIGQGIAAREMSGAMRDVVEQQAQQRFAAQQAAAQQYAALNAELAARQLAQARLGLDTTTTQAGLNLQQATTAANLMAEARARGMQGAQNLLGTNVQQALALRQMEEVRNIEQARLAQQGQELADQFGLAYRGQNLNALLAGLAESRQAQTANAQMAMQQAELAQRGISAAGGLAGQTLGQLGALRTSEAELAQQAQLAQRQLQFAQAQEATRQQLSARQAGVQATLGTAELLNQRQVAQAAAAREALQAAQAGGLDLSRLAAQLATTQAGLTQAQQLQTQQLDYQRAAQIDNLRMTAQQLALQGRTEAAQLLTQHADLLSRSTLAERGMTLQERQLDVQRAAQIDDLRFRARALEQQGQTDAARLLNEQADMLARQTLSAQGLALQAQGQLAGQQLDVAQLETQRAAQIDDLRLRARALEQQGQTDAARLLNEQADMLARTTLGAIGQGLQAQQLTGAQQLDIARLQEQARQFERSTSLQAGLEAQQLTQQGQIARAQGLMDVNRTALQSALQAAGLGQAGEQFGLQYAQQERLTSARNLIDFTNVLQSGELSRAQIGEQALQGRLDGYLNAVRTLANNALQYEGLATTQREQAIEVLRIAADLEAAKGQVATVIKQQESQENTARANSIRQFFGALIQAAAGVAVAIFGNRGSDEKNGVGGDWGVGDELQKSGPGIGENQGTGAPSINAGEPQNLDNTRSTFERGRTSGYRAGMEELPMAPQAPASQTTAATPGGLEANARMLAQQTTNPAASPSAQALSRLNTALDSLRGVPNEVLQNVPWNEFRNSMTNLLRTLPPNTPEAASIASILENYSQGGRFWSAQANVENNPQLRSQMIGEVLSRLNNVRDTLTANVSREQQAVSQQLLGSIEQQALQNALQTISSLRQGNLGQMDYITALNTLTSALNRFPGGFAVPELTALANSYIQGGANWNAGANIFNSPQVRAQALNAILSQAESALRRRFPNA